MSFLPIYTYYCWTSSHYLYGFPRAKSSVCSVWQFEDRRRLSPVLSKSELDPFLTFSSWKDLALKGRTLRIHFPL